MGDSQSPQTVHRGGNCIEQRRREPVGAEPYLQRHAGCDGHDGDGRAGRLVVRPGHERGHKIYHAQHAPIRLDGPRGCAQAVEVRVYERFVIRVVQSPLRRGNLDLDDHVCAVRRPSPGAHLVLAPGHGADDRGRHARLVRDAVNARADPVARSESERSRGAIHPVCRRRVPHVGDGDVSVSQGRVPLQSDEGGAGVLGLPIPRSGQRRDLGLAGSPRVRRRSADIGLPRRAHTGPEKFWGIARPRTVSGCVASSSRRRHRRGLGREEGDASRDASRRRSFRGVCV